jgi:TRAP-type C4-dicarboxylate transport system permease small subunit
VKPETTSIPAEDDVTVLEAGSIEEFVEKDRQVLASLPRAFNLIDTVLKSVMVAMLVVLIVAVGANMFGRFVLHESLAVSDELARFLFIWVIFLGGALAHLHREHIAVDILVKRLPASLQPAVTVLQELLIVALMIALLLSARDVMAVDPGTSPLLGVPYNWINVSVPFSAAIIGVVSLYRMVAAVRRSHPHQEA